MAIPAATPIIKPQETFPEKKPIPVAIMAKAANVLPALPVTILKALQIDFEKVLLEVLARENSPTYPEINSVQRVMHVDMHSVLVPVPPEG